ncbi:MAG TPA: M6 family metalloprotease domain-containing protein [Bacteroidales bacterium]|nr:M6 family metalloprotease domain-containing protein [Bacteroidales bacterium]
MRRALSLLLSIFPGFTLLSGAPLRFEPVAKQLPDGSILNLFLSGDEFFNYLHDASGFPVGQGDDRYYYYLNQSSDRFDLTSWKAGEADPFVHPELKPVKTPFRIKEKGASYELQMETYGRKYASSPAIKSTGNFNNLVIYIRFKDEGDFTVRRQVYETKFNSLAENSMRSYFREVSYDKLDIVTYHFPGSATDEIYYTDDLPRKYYQPYSVAANPDGYRNDDERTAREHSLIEKDVIWATDTYSLPADVSFDMDQNGKMDNISFIIKGSPDGWSDLLWPHRWILFSKEVKIGKLAVSDYTIQLENVSVNTLSHEIFHSLGAPDLYHYDNEDVPVGPWDIMANGKGHPGAWMKFRYGGWLDSIPEITQSGIYSLKSLTNPVENAYKIRSPFGTDQFFIVEYRAKSGLYESTLPSSGMIIQRIDTRYRGNAKGAPDEVYIFRKDGTPTFNGTINLAPFSGLNGADSFNDQTNPFSFLQDGTKAGIRITDIVARGDSLLFRVDLDNPAGLELSPVEDNENSIYSLPALGEKRSGIYIVPGLPYVQDFDDLMNELPRGWSSSLGKEGWSLNAPLNDAGDYEVIAEYALSGNWLYTPGFYLSKGKKYLVTFSFRNREYGVKESLDLKGGTDRHKGGLNSYSLFADKNFNYSGLVINKAVIQPTASGPCYFGFKTGFNGRGVILDNFMVERVPAATTNHSTPGEFYPNPTTGLITVPAKGRTVVSVFRGNGTPVFETEIEGMKVLDLSRLGRGVFIISFNTDSGVTSHPLIIQ